MHSARSFELPTGIVEGDWCCTSLCVSTEGVSVHFKYVVRSCLLTFLAEGK